MRAYLEISKHLADIESRIYKNFVIKSHLVYLFDNGESVSSMENILWHLEEADISK